MGVYLPPDFNCLRSTFDHSLRTRHYVHVVVAGKHALPPWLTVKRPVTHCTQGIGVWQGASNDQGDEPDVVMACCGDAPIPQALAATSTLREKPPDITVRVVNVVDLMRLQPRAEHPDELGEMDYDSLFKRDKPIVFAFHGYTSLVLGLTYRRANRHCASTNMAGACRRLEMGNGWRRTERPKRLDLRNVVPVTPSSTQAPGAASMAWSAHIQSAPQGRDVCRPRRPAPQVRIESARPRPPD